MGRCFVLAEQKIQVYLPKVTKDKYDFIVSTLALRWDDQHQNFLWRELLRRKHVSTSKHSSSFCRKIRLTRVSFLLVTFQAIEHIPANCFKTIELLSCATDQQLNYSSQEYSLSHRLIFSPELRPKWSRFVTSLFLTCVTTWSIRVDLPLRPKPRWDPSQRLHDLDVVANNQRHVHGGLAINERTPL